MSCSSSCSSLIAKNNRCPETTGNCCQQVHGEYVPEQVLAAVGAAERGCFPSIDSPSQIDTDFGFSIALSADGGVLVVGAPKYDAKDKNGIVVSNSGGAFVFERQASFSACAKDDGKFKLVQILSNVNAAAAAGATDSGFGMSVSVTGDGRRIAVGAPFQKRNITDENGVVIKTVYGEVFLYERNRNRATACKEPWTPLQQVLPQRRASATDCTIVDDNDQNIVGFGYRVALSRSGNVLMVADPWNTDDRGSMIVGDNGFVYFYEDRSLCAPSCGPLVSPYVFRQRITQEEVAAAANLDPANLMNIGYSLALTADGSIASFGASQATISGTLSAGYAFVYAREKHSEKGGGVAEWKLAQTLNAGAQPTGIGFGVAIATTPCGNYLAVESGGNFNPNFGFATVYRKTCSGGKLLYVRDGNNLDATLSENNEPSYFTPGQRSLAISDDGCVVAVGFERSFVSFGLADGDVAIFDRTLVKSTAAGPCSFGKCETKWVVREKRLTETPVQKAQFGTAVAMSGSGCTLAVGAPFADPSVQGLVSVFTASPARHVY